MPGVHRVYTWEDVPRKHFNTAIHTDHLVDPDDTYILDDVVRFVGQRVVAVLADSVGAAEEGCRKVDVDYELLPAVFDPEEAMADGAPQLHGSHDPFVQDPEHNILLELHGEIGDVEAGFAEADVIHEGTYFSPRVQHAHLETHGSIAWMEDGRLHVRTSSQSPSICKVKLAHLFDLRPDQLRVFCKRVGGGFGGKQEVISEDLVALATLDTGRPVSWEYTREEEFTTASPRHPMTVTVQARRQGRRHAHRVSPSATSPTPAPTATTAVRRCSPAAPPSCNTVAPTRNSMATRCTPTPFPAARCAATA